MGDDEELELLLQDLEDVETVEELQSHVLFGNEYFEKQGVDDVRLAEGGGAKIAVKLERWLSRLRSKMNQIAARNGAETFSISMSGSMTGPSVSVRVTYEVESEPATETEPE